MEDWQGGIQEVGHYVLVWKDKSGVITLDRTGDSGTIYNQRNTVLDTKAISIGNFLVQVIRLIRRI